MSNTDTIPGFSIEAMQSGDERAFEQLFRHFYKVLYFFTKRLTGDTFAAEEICAAVLFKLWQRRRDFDNLKPIKAFLYICAKNACLDYLDRQQRKDRHYKALRNVSEITEERILDDLYRAEVIHQVYYAIEQLPHKYAQIMKLAYIKGLKNNEIAHVLNMPLSTVNTQKARGLAALKKLLPRHFFTILLTMFP
jgi:RNA polymerase sigma-70 factor (ECF subfamily)